MGGTLTGALGGSGASEGRSGGGAGTASRASSLVLAVEEFSVALHTPSGTLRPVDRVSFSIDRGETLCLVGESGSGKSMTALNIMRLAEFDAPLSLSGRVYFEGQDLVGLPQSEMRALRGRVLAFVPQEPLSALNPVMSIGRQLEQVGTYHAGRRRDFRGRGLQALRSVGIGDAEDVMRRFPHQLSGGMRQRVMIAMALIAEPLLIIADEPTTALDVTTQAQILSLLAELQARTGAAVLMITHDLAVAAQVADKIAVMYSGRIVEQASAATLYGEGAVHPYTVGLLESVPSLEGARRERLHAIPGSVPFLENPPQGCHFAPRCSRVVARCRSDAPPLAKAPDTTGAEGLRHVVACWHPLERRPS